MKTISSQHHRDQNIVAEKLASGDYKVSVSPVFEFGGETIRVVLDGHHSLEAAKLAGVSPEFVELSASDSDKIALLDAGQYEDFLEITWMDGDWYDVETGKSVW